MNTTESKELVGKPGAGLPFFEWFVAKYFIFPSVYKKTTKEKAKQTFSLEAEKILRLGQKIEKEKMTKRVLIDRIRGLEDNSRYWSIAMAIEHLTIVGNGISDTIVELTKGGTNKPSVKIQDVKPNPDSDPAVVLENFAKMQEKFTSQIDISQLDNHPKATYDHPWFGPMNARQWYILAGRHQAIHREQIEAIIAKQK